MEKQKTTVRVAGKDYALVSTDSPEHLNRVAAYVDRQMTETMRSGRIPANTAAVLTALNLADDLMRAQDEVNRLRRELALLRESGKSLFLMLRLQGIGYFARFILLQEFRACGRDQRALRSPFGNLRGAHSCYWSLP